MYCFLGTAHSCYLFSLNFYIHANIYISLTPSGRFPEIKKCTEQKPFLPKKKGEKEEEEFFYFRPMIILMLNGMNG